MTEEQKVVAEKIIHILQKKEAQFEFTSRTIPQTEIGLSELDSREYKLYFSSVKTELIELEYIKPVNEYYFRLTEKGNKFKSFADLEKAEKDQQEASEMQSLLLKKEFQKINLEIDDLINRVIDYEKNRWKSNWSFWISVVTLLISILAIIISKKG
jgi:histidyl-tRNA synthetase